MDKDILAAIFGLNETIALFRIKPFDGALLHRLLLRIFKTKQINLMKRRS
jgi:hypothetical protein